MPDESYTPTPADRKVSVLHIAAGHLRATATATADDMIAFAEKLNSWVHGGETKPPRATKAAKPAAAETPAKTEEKPTAPAVEPDLGTDTDTGGDDDFLNEGASEPVKEKAKPATMEDVRAALLACQTRTDAVTARAVLTKAGGADTLGKLKQEQYQAVIDAAKKQTDKIAKAA